VSHTENAPDQGKKRLSSASLEELNSLSPTGSHVSLEKWLDTPPQNEAIPAGSLSAVSVVPDISDIRPDRLIADPSISRTGSVGLWQSDSMGSPPGFSTAVSPYPFARSVAGSEGSIGSFRSYGSRWSNESRGRRRGRRRWDSASSIASYGGCKRLTPSALSPSRPALPRFAPSQSEDSLDPVLLYFCTWVQCGKTFKTRFEWERHEAAIHYLPYRWICCDPTNDCSDLSRCFICDKDELILRHIGDVHANSCRLKPIDERTFWRSDQLAQHFKRAHGYTLPSGIKQAWFSENPHFDKSHLNCGFCGFNASDWAERQDHVSWHLEGGARKASWWPERRPISSEQYQAWLAAGHSVYPSDIQSWSCRFLDNYQSLVSASCELCGHHFEEDEDPDRHMDFHALRTCEQSVFTDVESLYCHLIETHGLVSDCTFRPYLWHHGASHLYDQEPKRED
jgi:hypothetical protein